MKKKKNQNVYKIKYTAIYFVDLFMCIRISDHLHISCGIGHIQRQEKKKNISPVIQR